MRCDRCQHSEGNHHPETGCFVPGCHCSARCASGLELKRLGQARAYAAAPIELKRQARATLWKLIQRQEFVTADDVQRAMAEAGHPLPARANWLPSIFRAAAAAGKLEDTGRYVPSSRTARRAAAIKQWRCTP